jgi:hypothetical protein
MRKIPKKKWPPTMSSKAFTLIIHPSEPKGALKRYLPRVKGFRVREASDRTRMSPPPEAQVSYKPPKYRDFRKSPKDPRPRNPKWAPRIAETLNRSEKLRPKMKAKSVFSSWLGPKTLW